MGSRTGSVRVINHGSRLMDTDNMLASLPPYLTPDELDRTLLNACEEDLGSGDYTSLWTVSETAVGEGVLFARQNGVIAGLTAARRLFQLLDPTVRVECACADADSVQAEDLIARVQGPLRSILGGERVALNFMQRMSGIATATRAFVDELRDTGTRVLDTRKTAPGLRLLDKWAVKIGGGVNHRLGLYHEIMIKENHITAAGGLGLALARVRAAMDSALKKVIVVEANSMDLIEQILAIGGVDRILLDNMVDLLETGVPDVSRLEAAIDLIACRVPTEASGNITLQTARIIALTGVDFISVGALTHSVAAMDLSLLIEPTN